MKTKEQKKAESEARKKEWEKLSPQQQLENLDVRKLRAKKQRARLGKLIKKEKG